MEESGLYHSNTHSRKKQSAFMVCGTHSGVGKTTISITLMSLLKEKGFIVQPFKQGPDFIDPGYHKFATGRDSIHLDFWMMTSKDIVNNFNVAMQDADIGVIEGMGAIFDGHNGTHTGCGAELASMLAVPIVLVVDIAGMTRSVNALLQGFFDFSPATPIVAVVFNRVGSKKHYEMVIASLLPRFRLLSLGYLPHFPQADIPERHLGLLTVEENHQIREIIGHYLERARETMQLDGFLEKIPFTRKEGVKVSKKFSKNPRVYIGVAQDKAFCFYYHENLQALEKQGAKLIYFSPMNDKKFPTEVDGLYLGGGYPELFARETEANLFMKSAIVKRADAGMPIYAECGGFIYLCSTLILDNENRYTMTGVFPYTVRWDKNYLVIRYVQIRTVRETILGPKNVIIKGQEFHQTRIEKTDIKYHGYYEVLSSVQEHFFEGHCVKNVLGSYIHLYFPSHPQVAENFVKQCTLYHRRRNALSHT